MDTRQIIGCFILAIILISEFLQYRNDRRAIAKGKKAIADLGYKVLTTRTTNAHYGLYFIVESKKIFVKFIINRDGTVKWIDGSPEDKIKKAFGKIPA
jgi:hypothetical protein